MDPETPTRTDNQNQPLPQSSQPFAVEPPVSSSPPPLQMVDSNPGQPVASAPGHSGLTKSTQGILIVVLLLLFAIIVSGVYLFSLSSRQTGQSGIPVVTTPSEPEVQLSPSPMADSPVTDLDTQINAIDTSTNEADFEEVEREMEGL